MARSAGATSWKPRHGKSSLRPRSRRSARRGRPAMRGRPSPGGRESGGAGASPFSNPAFAFSPISRGGQKTGFFLDQRDNRARLRMLARGKTVLNLFSYSGAFSVAALAGGASRAVDVDSSAAALALAREHRRAQRLPGRGRGLRRGGRLRGPAPPRRRGGAVGHRRLRPAGVREEEARRRPGRARLQGHQPPRDGPGVAGRVAR